MKREKQQFAEAFDAREAAADEGDGEQLPAQRARGQRRGAVERGEKPVADRDGLLDMLEADRRWRRRCSSATRNCIATSRGSTWSRRRAASCPRSPTGRGAGSCASWNAAVPDLASPIPGARTVPNAQHAYRQGKLLARNIIATLRGREPKPYVHHSLGAIATLGLGRGIFQYRRLVLTGLPAWLMHRGYHVLAVPSWERKVRVLAVWLTAALFGRDILSLASVQHPRDAFVGGGDRPEWNEEELPAPFKV
ncbi:hypothetical protein [Amycolatopsis sp. NPDC051061]|uniref:hypothetical protein n=1 Tax=Amycolatopsis sp. NPDC051061 TaxID=3155042 RepID=UPI00344A30AC